jgi:hypothetical protein
VFSWLVKWLHGGRVIREEIMNRTFTLATGVISLSLLMVTSAAWAQQQIRLRGTIEAVDGPVLTVKERAGTTVKVKMADNVAIRAVVKMSMADIKAGSYVGVTGMPQPDGSQKALEVHIFPEPMRGTGEGHRPWDLQPSSTMTNANVETTVASTDGQVLMMKYKDGEKKVIVPPTTPIVTYATASKDEVKPGIAIFINNPTKKEDGSYEAAAITISRGDVKPPM